MSRQVAVLAQTDDTDETDHISKAVIGRPYS